MGSSPWVRLRNSHRPNTSALSATSIAPIKALQIWREVEKKSVLLSLVSKSVILHGSVSVHSVRGPDGEKRRHVIPMQSHSYSMDIPRQTVVNPFDLDYILRAFRAEPMPQ